METFWDLKADKMQKDGFFWMQGLGLGRDVAHWALKFSNP